MLSVRLLDSDFFFLTGPHYPQLSAEIFMDEEIEWERFSWKQSRGGRKRGYSWKEVGSGLATVGAHECNMGPGNMTLLLPL